MNGSRSTARQWKTIPAARGANASGRDSDPLPRFPLLGTAGVIGVLGVAAVAARDFRQHRDFLEACSRQIAAALQNALLHQDLQRTAGELAARVAELKQTEESLRLDESRLNSLLYLAGEVEQLSEREIVQRVLEEAVHLTRSQIGYFHFVNEDQESIELHTWSRATLAQCTAVHAPHYPVSEAGVWADCVRTGRPVVHNDYPNLPHKRGLPDGHAPLARHVSVPVTADGKIRLVLGVGNKVAEYDAADVRQLQLLANDAWKLVQRGRTNAALRPASNGCSMWSATIR